MRNVLVVVLALIVSPALADDVQVFANDPVNPNLPLPQGSDVRLPDCKVYIGPIHPKDNTTYDHVVIISPTDKPCVDLGGPSTGVTISYVFCRAADHE